MTPTVSVLLPTRGRPQALKQSIESLFDLAAQPDRIEVLLRTDDDESPALQALGERANVLELRGKRLGYLRMHDYYNLLAQFSTGAHLMIWNDDCVMLTPQWEEKLELSDPLSKLLGRSLAHYRAPTVKFIRRDTLEQADDTFPIVARSVYEAMGHLAEHCFVDSWISRVAHAAGIASFHNDVTFHHHRLADATMNDQLAQISPAVLRAFAACGAAQWRDAEAVRAMIAKRKL